MKHKKHDSHAEDEEHTDAAATEQAAIPAAGGSDEVESLRSRLSEAEAKAAEHLDGWQRALADFQNYRKRLERDRDAERVAMKGDLIRSVLPVLDDLERALQNRPEDDAWSNGIELIQRKLLGLLEAEGVKRIEAEGAVFD
jgi:molecular chaperone GrpE